MEKKAVLRRCADVDDVVFASEVVALEKDGFPPDEGASEEKMKMRRDHAAGFFWVALLEGTEEVAGFVNGTCTGSEELSEECMSKHDPDGSTLCIHSVVVKQALRRTGLGRAILRRYLEIIASTQPQIALVVLLSKLDLVPLYESCGFINQGESKVQHGKDRWYQLNLELARTPVSCANAFANRAKRFSGNPAAVCVVPFRTRSLPSAINQAQWELDGKTLEEFCEVWMDKVAEQMNLSETAFLRDLGRDDERTHRFELRWRTPESEVDLCGHATMASACSLWDKNSGFNFPPSHFNGIDKFVFESRSGELFACKTAEGEVFLDFPITYSDVVNDEAIISELVGSLGVSRDDIEYIGENSMDYVVRVKSRAIVEGVHPDFRRMGALKKRAVNITSLANNGDSFDFVSRLFGPAVGIEEDPFTGSAHCYLAPYWSKVLGKTTMAGFQASKRGGFTTVSIDESKGRVKLQGFSEMSWRGEVLSTPFFSMTV